MTSKELYNKLAPMNKQVFKNASMTKYGLSINIESMFSLFIKEAARCNAYNSDVVYDIDNIKNALENFDPEKDFEPIWIGFRKMGVDGTSYVLCHTEDRYPQSNLSSHYFALYSIMITPSDYDFYDITLSEYAV